MDQQEQAKFFIEQLNAKDAEIAQLRADIAEARAAHDATVDTHTMVVNELAQLRADLARVTAELDEAIEDRRQARDDAARAAALLAVRTMERDARPEISREDARAGAIDAPDRYRDSGAYMRVYNALRAHAEEAKR